MGYILCTAEKPSVAKNIASVIGANERKNGYFQGNGYIVTWAVGHLVGLAEPEEYNFVSQIDMYSDDVAKERAYAELPLIPSEFKFTVLESTKEQFKIVKELMHRSDVDYIIDCGDMGAEGHILQWLIREKAGCTKPVKRFCATSMTDEAIKQAMDTLKDIGEFDSIIRGELCKKKQDWILGMSLSRALSIKYSAGINVGRVQSPTLGFVVKRYLEVINFKVTDYYTLDATISEGSGFHVFWNKDTDGVFPAQMKTSEGRVLNKGILDIKRAEIMNHGKGVITELISSKKATDRPQLYDITELQRDANRKYGYTAAATLATAQALYETHKVLSYPRTDSRYITSDLVPYMTERVSMIGSVNRYAGIAQDLNIAGLHIDKKIVDDSKVSDHHALIPTEKIENFDFSKLSPTEEEKKKGVTKESLYNVLDLILVRVLVAFSKAYKYEQTNITITFPNGMNFTASGKKPVYMGWKSVQQVLNNKKGDDGAEDIIEDEKQLFPDVYKGQTVSVSDCKTVSKKTSPPKLHTEATLLTAMENAGQQIENGAILKGKGIGTQATRADIIKKLFDTNVIESEVKGKTSYIKPTKKGINIIRILPHDLYSPKITADWETRISEIVDGKTDEDKVMEEFEKYIKSKTEEVKNINANVSFKKEREVVGSCPWCGEAVYVYEEKTDKGKVSETRYYCSEKCDWNIKDTDMTFMVRLGRKITEAEAKKMIAKSFIVLDCKKKDGTGKYKGEFTFIERISNGKRYCNIRCVPVKAIKRKG